MDTSFLRTLRFSLSKDFRLIGLQDIIQPLGVSIYIPRIVRDELSCAYIEDMERSLNNLQKDIENINKYLDRRSEFHRPSNKKIFFIKVKERIDRNLKEAKIHIFKESLEAIRINGLIDMAVNRKKPFDSEGRGFKDAIILYSIIEHCKKYGNTEHFFLTHDENDFRDMSIEEIIKRNRVKLTVFFAIDDLVQHLGKVIGEADMFHIERQNRLRMFLLDKRLEIAKFVLKEIDFFSKKENPKFSEFVKESEKHGRKIGQDAEIQSISSPKADYLSKTISEGRVMLWFEVDINFIIRYTTIRWPDAFESEINWPYKRIIVIKGSIYIRQVNGKEEFSDLRLDNASLISLE